MVMRTELYSEHAGKGGKKRNFYRNAFSVVGADEQTILPVLNLLFDSGYAGRERITFSSADSTMDFEVVSDRGTCRYVCQHISEDGVFGVRILQIRHSCSIGGHIVEELEMRAGVLIFESGEGIGQYTLRFRNGEEITGSKGKVVMLSGYTETELFDADLFLLMPIWVYAVRGHLTQDECDALQGSLDQLLKQAVQMQKISPYALKAIRDGIADALV